MREGKDVMLPDVSLFCGSLVEQPMFFRIKAVKLYTRSQIFFNSD